MAQSPVPQYASDGDSKPLGPRVSHKRFSRPSTAFESSGLESIYDHPEAEKEVVCAPPLPPPDKAPQAPAAKQRRLCTKTRLWAIALLGVVLAIIVAIVVGLRVGLATKKPDSRHSSSMSDVDPRYSIGGAIDPVYFSTRGAFNGSGIAFASQSFSPSIQTSTHGIATVYFQYYDGTVRFVQLSPEGKWQGGDISTIVASDARNSTPLSAVSYSVNGTSSWHLFYIDRENRVRQRSNSNMTNVWTDGPINSANIVAYSADQVGMQACWYGNDYGNFDSRQTSPSGQGGFIAHPASDAGINLWCAINATAFQQWVWRASTGEWTYEQDWSDKNGHAGVGCYSWGPGTVTYVTFVNTQDTVEFWWKDTDMNGTATKGHPIDAWTNSSISIPDVNPATSLGYTNFFYAQAADTNLIMGYNVSWDAENTSFVGRPFNVADIPGLSGTRFAVNAMPTLSNGNDLVVFFQENGSDVSQYTRDSVGGVWSHVAVPIPGD
ncbi:hypothetical protein Tdes44962_MAKER00188 [Teratosphaeria destructans]|uniref:Fucose-specific lectin n=1 Tax=Teratosphaeria destructans TaxID=418781 RepID=A0A9W7SV16_9PEZI|nr:hypothetical protein Tdes44962_MAKER00188 [Teratosphaeria destructans]